MANFHFIFSPLPFLRSLLSLLKHLFFLIFSKASVLRREERVDTDVKGFDKWVRFSGMSSEGNGGCILCESNIMLEIRHFQFRDIRCEGEGVRCLSGRRRFSCTFVFCPL